jgi:hypothetical protein
MTERQRRLQSIARLMDMIEQLRAALIGVSERELPGDSLPCYCVRYERGDHDEWCDIARVALAETADLSAVAGSEPLPHDETRTGS